MFKFCLLFCMGYVSFAVLADNSSQSDTAAVNRLLKQSTSQQRINVDSCSIYATQALRLAEKIHYPNGIAGAYIQLSCVMMIRGKSDSSLFYANQALFYSRPVHDNRRTSFAFLLQSYLYEGKGKPDSAFLMIYEALRYAKLSQDSTYLLQVYVAMGSLHSDYKEYSKSLIYYLNGYQVAIRLNSLNDASDALTGIGNVYYQQDKTDIALRYYLQVDSLSRLIGETTGVLQNLNNIALCYADLKQKQKALDYYMEALTGFQKFGMRSEEANLYFNVGCLYSDLQESDSAIHYLNIALPLAKEIDEPEKVAHCLKMLATSYAQKSDFKKAYAFHLAYSSISDSILNAEKISSISEMQTKYETELKTKEITDLQHQNEISTLKASRRLGISLGLGVTVLAILIVAFGYYKKTKKEQRLNAELFLEKKKSDDLLLNILPEEVADELKQTGFSKARLYNNVTVLFTDFVNFTGISEQLSPTELVHEINKNFTGFDAIIEKHGLEKIKTIGDAYLAVCGLPNEVSNHAERVIHAALDIQQFMLENEGRFQIRIGIHSGPVVAGIVGVKKYAYDIWGDTVNMANRMESNSESGKINLSGATYDLIKHAFGCTYRGKVKVKNRGEVDMYFVDRRLSA